MTIQYASDLHLEFPDNEFHLKTYPLIKKADILILAGDIFYMNEKYYPGEILDQWSEQYEVVYIIPGNHEFYQNAFPVKNIFPSLNLQIRDNIYVLNNQVKSIGGIRLIFSTLFTRIPPDEAIKFKRSMNDFHICRYSEKSNLSFSIDEYNYCHSKCKAFIEIELEKFYSGKTVVVTHHVPYPNSIIPGYPDHGQNNLTNGFHVDLTKLIQEYPVDYWISGHSHFNHDPIKIHKTKCLTNQLGYVAYGESQLFARDKALNIK